MKLVEYNVSIKVESHPGPPIVLNNIDAHDTVAGFIQQLLQTLGLPDQAQGWCLVYQGTVVPAGAQLHVHLPDDQALIELVLRRVSPAPAPAMPPVKKDSDIDVRIDDYLSAAPRPI